LNKENERKAAKAMESLNVTAAPAALKEGDVELIVSLYPFCHKVNIGTERHS